mmetsp:Transcript_58343/g.161334  ORF Transcript_58343/g.161334 Transcript_58343/m.161334 type:complete len:534 (-) Transcript_58343:2-1603(-)
MVVSWGAPALGILSVFASSLTTTFGIFFQKIAQRRILAGTDSGAACCWTVVVWFLGFSCFPIFSFVLDLYSMATLAQSLVVPLLACLEVAWNQTFVPIVLCEHIDKCRDTSASAVVVLGALCIMLFGPGGFFGGTEEDPTPEMDYPEMKEYFTGLFSAPGFIAFEVLTLALLVACLVLSQCEWCGKLHVVMLGYVAGALGGQQDMFLKGVGTSLGTSLDGDLSVFADWVFYAFAIFLVSLASMQLFFLNIGLAKSRELHFVPAYTLLYILSGTLAGLVIYQEYRFITNLGWVVFCIGFILIATAMYILATKSEKPTQEDIVTFSEYSAEVLGKTDQDLTPSPSDPSSSHDTPGPPAGVPPPPPMPYLLQDEWQPAPPPDPAPYLSPRQCDGSTEDNLEAAAGGSQRLEHLALALPDKSRTWPSGFAREGAHRPRPARSATGGSATSEAAGSGAPEAWAAPAPSSALPPLRHSGTAEASAGKALPPLPRPSAPRPGKVGSRGDARPSRPRADLPAISECAEDGREGTGPGRLRQ